MTRLILINVIVLTSIYFAQTNYIVDNTGNGNFRSIKEVNSTNFKAGDIVSFKSGQQFSDAVLECKSGITYNTYGGTTKAIIGNPSSSQFECSIFIDNKDNVLIDNLQIFGTNNSRSDAILIYSYIDLSNPNSQSQKNIVISNCIITGGNNSTIGNGHGIFCNGGINGLRITNNTINYFREGIYISAPYNVEISNNEIFDIFFNDPSKGSFNPDLRGAEAIELYGVDENNNSWNCNYTVKISNNNIYNFETSALVTTTLSKIIIEYNRIHDNLDPKIYHGGIDHTHALGKIDDYSYGVPVNYPGSIGTIIRYNKIYNISRGQTSEKYSAHNGFVFNYNGVKYESDGSVYLDKYYSIDPNYSPYSLGAAIDGSGYDMQIYGNLFYKCDRRAIIRTQKTSAVDMTNSKYKNEIYNNTFWDVAYDPLFSENYNGASIVASVEKQSPIYVRNNIFYISSKEGSAIYTQYAPLFEGNNIFFVQNNVITNKEGNENHISPPVAIFVSKSASMTQVGNSSTFGVPLSKASDYFIDYLNGDFRLKTNSPAIDAGFNLGNDKSGNSRISGRGIISGQVDIGAFEFGYEDSQNLDNYNNSENITLSNPVIASQPTSRNVNLSNEVSFSINATCNDEIGYQWWKEPFLSESESKIVDNSKYSGSATGTLTIKNVSEDDAKVKYICEVYNTKDRSNYWINSNAASIVIISSQNSQSKNGGLKVLLEGAVNNSGTMNSGLVESNSFPMTQPYNSSPWNFNNNESVNILRSNFVDWVLIELRNDLNNTSYRKTGILTVDGNIINSDGTPFSFSSVNNGNYYIAIRNRNHLSIISSVPISVIVNEAINYDFTISASASYGNKSQVKITGNKFAMIAGDADGNGIVNNLDFGIVANSIPAKGYLPGDLDMNGIVNVLDYSKINANILNKSSVP
jgi:hypothetical protein